MWGRAVTAMAACVVAVHTAARAESIQPLDIGAGERLVVVAPHPDDETLGAGGLIQRVLARGGSVRVVLVTAGDGYVEAVVHETGLPRPRPAAYVAYGKRRLREAGVVLRTLGPAARLEFLGFPDGGLETLLRAHWSRTHPERSQTTGATDPPYAEAIEPDIPYDGADLRRELVRLLREAHPTIVAFPDPLDKHPDHRATGLFTLLALADWSGKPTVSGTTPGAPVPVAPMPGAAPRLLAYLVHWPDWPPGWNSPVPVFNTSAPLQLSQTLPPRKLAVVALTLNELEVDLKRTALARYTTQQDEMAPLLAGFVRRTEPFTVFTKAQFPHIGRLIERRKPTPAPTSSR
jgi:LmbE family N-acetylglucosaminyl deacetylase